MSDAGVLAGEERFLFTNQDSRLVAALHHPRTAADTVLVLLHGWTGCRAGPHQMFVKLARQAAAAGTACARFDFRGRGDSEGDAYATSLSTMISDTRRIAEVLAERLGPVRLALVGDCSGSEVALGAAALIPAAERLVLWSAPPVAADRGEVHRSKHRRILLDYARKAMRLETWRRLLRRQVRLDMVGQVIRSGGKGWGEEGQASDREIDWLDRFRHFSGRILYLYGSNDPTTPRCMEHYQQLSEEAGRPFEHHLVEGANHAFYSLAWEQEVLNTTLDWLADWRASRRGEHV